MANNFVCVHMSSNYHLTVLNLFTYLLILCINCAYVIIFFILHLIFETVKRCIRGLRFLRSSSKPYLRPNQTGQRSVSKGNACSIGFIGRDKGMSKRMSETLSRGLFLVLRIYFLPF
jgi:hypothetical protein